jgi:hypothetical protein
LAMGCVTRQILMGGDHFMKISPTEFRGAA